MFRDTGAMFHARDDWANAVPATAALAPAGAGFGRRREAFSLAVDLSAHLFSRTWWRGSLTLFGLCGAVMALAPGLEPLPIAAAPALADPERFQADALAIAPLNVGSATGLRMAPAAVVEPIEQAPQRAQVEHRLILAAGDRLERLFGRVGASYADSSRAAALLRAAGDRVEPGTAVAVVLGQKAGAFRPIERVTLRAGLGVTLTIVRGSEGLELVRQAAAVDSTPLRIRGRVGDGFYWSLRAAGVSPQAAADYLKAVGSRIDVGGDVAADDHFDLIIANRRAATGESRTGALLYAALDRTHGDDVQLVRWTAGGRTDWFDANTGPQQNSDGMMAPTAGPVTSGFGYRVHPILRFKRMHRGVDFGGGYGAPIVAAADGQVVKAGWAGGYGRQVRLAHGDGLVTTYSHMSRMVAEPGTVVRQGQVIGYIGSSGLSTGPHLHYEVYRGGVAVNPMTVRFARRSVIDPAARDAFKARLRALLQVGAPRLS